MLKVPDSMKAFERNAAYALESILKGIPIVTLESVEVEPRVGRHEIDVLVRLTAARQSHVLVCEAKYSGQPRYVRQGLLHLRNYLERSNQPATPVLIAPYLSPEARTICQENKVGYLDLQGNVRLEFDGVFIERIVADKPAPDRRELKSLFRPKSALVLKTLLRDPERRWRVEELARSAGVSLGHASNVRSGLLAREWAEVSELGLFLSKPNELLDAWRDAYEPPLGERMGFYTVMHGKSFDDAARASLGAHEISGRAIFASFSAAQWMAPYGRTGMQYFYADEAGLERLKHALHLSVSSKGENVVVTLPKDRGLLEDTVEPAPGAFCTGPLQTYLDLSTAGERGREAAEHLRREQLTWPK
jgi:Transcriptional regulator, AbiEi antitoxin, Type IV TA system